jgi:hypothetical protein
MIYKKVKFPDFLYHLNFAFGLLYSQKDFIFPVAKVRLKVFALVYWLFSKEPFECVNNNTHNSKSQLEKIDVTKTLTESYGTPPSNDSQPGFWLDIKAAMGPGVDVIIDRKRLLR